MYVLKENITDQPIEGLDTKFLFASVDLAPNDQLETGFSVLDRDRNLVRMEKIYTNQEIVRCISQMGPPSETVVLVDMPKNLSLPNRWVQEEVKMHAHRLERETGDVASRFEERGRRLYNDLDELGALSFLYFNYWTRLNYSLLIPYRSRSPQGCRALQTGLFEELGIKNLPNNLAPSSVLESMVGAYAAWSLWAGEPTEDYQLYLDDQGYRIMIPEDRPHRKEEKKRRRRWRRGQEIGRYDNQISQPN